MAAKLDGKRVLAEAEAAGQVHLIKSGWKKAIIFSGILTCLFIITIPFGIWMFFVAARARMGFTDEALVVRWFGTTAYRWEDIEAFEPVAFQFHVHGAGLVGALVGAAASAVVTARTEGLKGPLAFKMRGQRTWKRIPAQAVQRSVELAQAMERHTGLQIFPPDSAPKAG